MELSEKQKNIFLFTAEGVGAAFVGVFLAAYLAGLPTTEVFHSEPVFRIPLMILGVVFLALIFSAFILAAFSKKE